MFSDRLIYIIGGNYSFRHWLFSEVLNHNSVVRVRSEDNIIGRSTMIHVDGSDRNGI